MAFRDNSKEDEHHKESILHYLEPTRVIMMSFDLGLGAFAKASIILPSLDPFPPWFYFSELATDFFALPSYEDLCFEPTSCLDGNHQGSDLAHETTQDEYLRIH